MIHVGVTMVHMWDIVSILEDVQYIEGCHWYIGGCSAHCRITRIHVEDTVIYRGIL